MIAWLLWPFALAYAEVGQPDSAEIVLVGAAASTPELRLVLTELLQRDGVEPAFRPAERFSADALLAEPDGDGRVRVFITLPTPLLARLYLRGPFGQRFLLRELPLRSGIDELGSESIAQVVATSTQALLHSRAGIDRETARAGLLREQSEPAPAAPVVQVAPVHASPAPNKRHLRYELSARGVAAWTGTALRERLGAGLEVGVSQLPKERLLVRERLVFEQLVAQSLDAPQLAAELRTSALRLGVDLGLKRGPNAFLLAVAGGVDLVHIDPESVHDASWKLAKERTDAIAMLRAELRFERLFSAFLLGIAATMDVALSQNHYTVRDGEELSHVAKPWRVTPGLALSLGWCSPD